MVRLGHKLLFFLVVFLGIRIIEVVHSPLIAQIVRNVAPISLLSRTGLDAVGLQLVLDIGPGFPADVLEAADHSLAGVHGLPGKGGVLNAHGLDVLGHTFLHVAPGQLFGIRAHTLHGGGQHLVVAHSGQFVDFLLLLGLFCRLTGLPFSLALGLGLLVGLFLIVLTHCAVRSFRRLSGDGIRGCLWGRLDCLLGHGRSRGGILLRLRHNGLRRRLRNSRFHRVRLRKGGSALHPGIVRG